MATQRQRRVAKRKPGAGRDAKMEALDLGSSDAVKVSGSGQGEDVGHVDLTGKEDGPSDSSWWVFVMPSQAAAPAPVPGGRYGFWASKPDIKSSESEWIITSSESRVSDKAGEPEVRIAKEHAMSVYTAQMKHTINPTVPITEPQ